MAARYRIIEEIGRGAMGRVYLAHDNLLDRRVALKELIAPDYLSGEEKEEIRERFRLEARAAARLTHAHVLTVHDIVVSGDRQFIVMEYLEGKTLREILAERIFSAEEVLSIAPMISDALDYAHSKEIIHRDVKPDNIFVLENGNIKVADFGIAKMLKVKEMTQTGVIMGTPNYIAPELVKDMEYDHRVDIFSLGVTLYEILAGRRPFDAESDYAIIYKVASEEAVPLNEIRDDLPDDLVRVVRRALEKNPDKRYPSMEELKKDLMKVRAELGMVVEKEEEKPFDKEQALYEELEAAKGIDDYQDLDGEASGELSFSRDKEWKKLIARIYHGGEGEEEYSSATTRLTVPSELEVIMGAGSAVPPTRRVVRMNDDAGTAAAHKRVPARVATSPGGDRAYAYAETAAPAFQPYVLLKDQKATTRWSGVLIAVGVLTIVCVVLPWIGETLNPGRSLSGLSFPEGMIIAALCAIILGADALILLGVGEPRTWLKVMKVLSMLCVAAIIIFIPLRVVMGLGYEQVANLQGADYIKGIGWGLWFTLVFSILTCWACYRTEDAAI
ncbi:MAG: serine/threonine-protein kinase [Actinomycetota bacterium]|nr:serine/threonine-protein kinase [Actinomycetota bacterium]